jgi:hypothetical protein
VQGSILLCLLVQAATSLFLKADTPPPCIWQVWKLAYTATTAPVCEYYMTEVGTLPRGPWPCSLD